MSSSSSPQKRQTDDTNGSDAKRVKIEEDSIDPDDFLTGDLDVGLDTDPLLQMPHIDSTLPSGQVSAMDTPTLVSLEIQTAEAQLFPETTMAQVPRTSDTAAQSSSQTPMPQQQQQAPKGQDTITKPSAGDPDKLSDALLSAGVDLKAEEALLNSTVNALPSRPQQQESNVPQGPLIINTPFLDPRQVNWFMNKICNANGLKNGFKSPQDLDASIINLMTFATEEWMKNILTNAVILSRHRRRSVKNRKRSELSVALRDLNVKAKTQEDRRQERKKRNGMDKTDDKEATEEIQHKATNATVAMMTGKKKKYDWMSSGGSSSKNTGGDVSTRFREAREEPGLVVRDLLNSLEKKRMGVEKTIAKGYAKLKD